MTVTRMKFCFCYISYNIFIHISCIYVFKNPQCPTIHVPWDIVICVEELEVKVLSKMSCLITPLLWNSLVLRCYSKNLLKQYNSIRFKLGFNVSDGHLGNLFWFWLLFCFMLYFYCSGSVDGSHYKPMK